MVNNCVTSTLAPYQPGSGGWTAAHVGHLYASVGYGSTVDQIEQGLSMTPSDLVASLISIGVNSPLPVDPFWADWNKEDYEVDTDLIGDHIRETKRAWLRRGTEHPFQQKMSIFWHDHFSTERGVYGCNRYMWSYYKLLHQFSFGNFRTFVEQMGLTEAMLVYLDGNDNRVGSPNENYARELMELFTMGEGNGYTQEDIVGVARALTGYVVDREECTLMEYNPDRHDNGMKTIFGQTGNFNYADVHELIFSLKDEETARYICSKLYKHFIYKDPDAQIVQGMAETFIANNWEIVPVLQQLLSSEYFFEQAFQGAKIKSPIDLTLQLMNSLNLVPDVNMNENVFNFTEYRLRVMGMELFQPPNVAGWPGNRFWLNENALAYRWSFTHIILNSYVNDTGYDKIRQIAIDLTNGSNDPNEIVTAFSNHILNIDLNQDLIDVGIQYLKAGIPENYFEDGSWNLYWDEAPEQMLNLLKYIVRLPEYQLT